MYLNKKDKKGKFEKMEMATLIQVHIAIFVISTAWHIQMSKSK